MAAEELKEPGKTKKEGYGEITFRCRYCGKDRKLEDMRVITRFFPPMEVCRECEKEIR
jgi:hypothetical protein